ncbi:tryptophanyl-tRNA synthetase [Basidiobolus meristosporus CBS 931.73]|uniref:Tryptophan--tRNA ligase, mitochondrial n=1 Tax=Basidiobolus meristosporus CBS 931.73 TaxID=1314790 RepID=A0A1Y1XRH9_9FUNG|nr:tryptophanyl-tRNA synthetase [Basidiobolus meristosporus CBS 931.73]|eukprot:ORX88333.1 tryptophanyl-tRNA synthetase [Basidiobolus meristosporus CBS 931.73]
MSIGTLRGALSLANADLAKLAVPPEPKERTVLSGIQPTGSLHLGNYLGAVANWVKLQDEYAPLPFAEDMDKKSANVLYSIVDLHAITLPQDPVALRKSIKNSAIALLACGIDVNRVVLFRQSRVTQHAELTWLLTCMTPVSWLTRMTQWKSKLQLSKGIQSITEVDASAGLQLGLFAYPVLMASDILVYNATHVPVGEDQLQHLELARDIATTFNHRYQKEVFNLPQPILTQTRRVMSLRNASSKMSKSDPSDNTRINLNDPADVIVRKIRKATTDSISGITYQPEQRPELANLLRIYSGISGKSVEELCEIHCESNNAKFKEDLAEVLVQTLAPIQAEMKRLEKDPQYVENVLLQGEAKAAAIAKKNLTKVFKVTGLM